MLDAGRSPTLRAHTPRGGSLLFALHQGDMELVTDTMDVGMYLQFHSLYNRTLWHRTAHKSKFYSEENFGTAKIHNSNAWNQHLVLLGQGVA